MWRQYLSPPPFTSAITDMYTLFCGLNYMFNNNNVVIYTFRQETQTTEIFAQ